MIGAADVNPLKAAWDAEIALEHLLRIPPREIDRPAGDPALSPTEPVRAVVIDRAGAERAAVRGQRREPLRRNPANGYVAGVCAGMAPLGMLAVWKPTTPSAVVIAALMGAESALVFSTGYQTNLGVISALATRGMATFDIRISSRTKLITSSVGIIDPDGIWKASTMDEARAAGADVGRRQVRVGDRVLPVEQVRAYELELYKFLDARRVRLSDHARAIAGLLELVDLELAVLAQHHDETVTRQMIAREVWREPNRATPLDNVIDVHLAHLRRKLDDGEDVKLIQTVRGVGFVLRAGAAVA